MGTRPVLSRIKGAPERGWKMKKLILILLLLSIFFVWAVHKSGAIEEKVVQRYSNVPGGERTSREYRFNWSRLQSYLKSLIPG